MNALELAEMIRRNNAGVHSQKICEDYMEAADMLRRQHEAIQKLREAVGDLLNDNSDEYIPSRLWDNARQALKDTEDLK